MHRRRLERDLRDELAQHLEARARSLIDEGVAPDEARRRAARAIGNLTRLREDSREQWGFPALDSAIQDLRYGARQLRRSPLFTAAATLTLALTIGSTAALFAIVNAVILRPLPYRQSDRIMDVAIEQEGRAIGRMDAPTAVIAMRVGTRAFESVAAYDSTGGNLTGGAQPERVSGALVGPAFFDVMGVAPLLGRRFDAGDVGPGGPGVIMLSSALWERTFGATTDLGDRVVRLDDVAYRVIGVMPAGFRFPGRAEVLAAVGTSGRRKRRAVLHGLHRPLAGRRLPRHGARRALRSPRGARQRAAGPRASDLDRHRQPARVAARWIQEPARAALRDRRVRPADRVRQRRQPPARPRRGAAAGAGPAHRARCRSPAAGAPAPHRERAAWRSSAPCPAC